MKALPIEVLVSRRSSWFLAESGLSPQKDGLSIDHEYLQMSDRWESRREKIVKPRDITGFKTPSHVGLPNRNPPSTWKSFCHPPQSWHSHRHLIFLSPVNFDLRLDNDLSAAKSHSISTCLSQSPVRISQTHSRSSFPFHQPSLDLRISPKLSTQPHNHISLYESTI